MRFTVSVGPSRLVRVALLAWIGLEIAAFLLVVHLIGPGGAVLAGLATSLLGFSQLRRAGLSAVAKLRAGFGGRTSGGATGGPLVDETLGTVGGLCLLLPGFLSDIVGLALAVPAVRGWARARLGRWAGRRVGLGSAKQGSSKHGSTKHGPGAIDLDPTDWRHTDDAAPDRSRPIPPPPL